MQHLRLVIPVALVILVTTRHVNVVADEPRCRASLYGVYVFVHTGIKPNGHFFSAIAYFTVHPEASTFDVEATINERGVGNYTVRSANHPFGWRDGCVVSWDREGFIGHVSADGSQIAFVTLDDEQLAGLAFRVP